jgi:hypothetical protein
MPSRDRKAFLERLRKEREETDQEIANLKAEAQPQQPLPFNR